MQKLDNLLSNLITNLISYTNILAITPYITKDNAYIYFT